MKKRNCKNRLMGVAIAISMLVALGLLGVVAVLTLELINFVWPTTGLATFFKDGIGSALCMPILSVVATLLMLFAIFAYPRKSNSAWVALNILLLAGVTFVLGEVAYRYYLDAQNFYAICSALLTLLAFVSFVLNFVALFVKPAKPVEETSDQLVNETQPELQPVVEEVIEPTPVVEEVAPAVADQPAVEQPIKPVDAVTQRQLARLKTLLEKGVINQNQYEKLVEQFTNNN